MTVTNKFISPVVITDAMLISSTAPETDYPEWDIATAYVVGGRCIRVSTHRVYECLVNNTGYTPESNITGVAPKWQDIGPTNRWAMHDNVAGTVTTTTGDLVVVVEPGSVSGVGLLDVYGQSASVSMKDRAGGTVAYEKTITLDGRIITSVYEWFFKPAEMLTDVVITDMPFHWPDCELTITISAAGGVAGCGVCKMGEVVDIGNTERGATAGIRDFSRKQKNTFGNYELVERDFSKRSQQKIEIIGMSRFNYVYRLLAKNRATLCIWIGVDARGFEPFFIYGWFDDFEIDVAYAELLYCTLKIEGIV